MLAWSSQITKGLAMSFPHRQLVAPLLLINCLLVAPFCLGSPFRESVTIAVLQVASAATLVGGSFAIFDLFRQGSAAAVAVGQAITPVPALAFSLLLLSSSVTVWQAVGDVVVSAAVLLALGPVFGQLSRLRAAVTVLLAAAFNGLLVVLTKLLTDRGVGVAEIYATRTGLAGVAARMIVAPRDIPLGAYRPLTVRSAMQSAYFVLLILAVQRGSPVTVQTLAATTPIMLLVADAVLGRRRPPARLVLAALGVMAGVALSVT
nr:EamA family transporter [Solirubrobacteraceae bacterium]